MSMMRRSTDGTRVLVQVALLACCVAIAGAVRDVVEADAWSDRTELALNVAALVVLLASVAISFGIARITQARAPRVGAALVCMLLVGLAGGFVRQTYADVSIELADLVEPAQAAEGAAQIVVGPTGEDVRLSGDINEGAASLLERILVAHPSIERIALTSDGGFADEGQALAEVIAAHGLTTYVPDYCVSACTLAFVGGRERLLMEGARLGFHAPYQQGLLGQTFAGDASEQRAAYIRAGVTADFVDAALKVSPDDLWIPERSRLLAAHVATGYVDRYRFPDSILDGTANGQGARDAVLRNFSMLKSLDVASPQVVDRIADWYLQAYRRGASEGEATDGLKTIVGAAVTLVLARADDATLLDVTRFVGSALNVELPPRECATIGAHVDLVRATAALERSDEAADTLAERLVASALTSGRNRAPESLAVPVAYVPRHDTCAALRQAYAEASRHRDLADVRRRILAEVPRAASVLVPVVAEKALAR